MASKKFMLDVIIGGRTSAGYLRSMSQAERALNSFRNTARIVTGAVGAAFASMRITEQLTDFINTYKEFESSVAKTSAIFSASTEERIKLEEAAVAASKETLTSSTDAASALSYMALAGWEVNESIASLVPMLKLAESTGEDTQRTTDLVTDSMSAMGIEIGNLEEYLDKLASVNNNANTTAIMAMESLVKSGGAMRSLMSTPEETAEGVNDMITAVGILANNGTKAAEAGTVLNSVLSRLATNKNAKKALDELGISIYDDQGSFIGIENYLRKLGEVMDTLSVDERVKILGAEAGQRMYSRFQYLLDAVSSGTQDGADAWNELETKIAESDGALSSFHKTATNSLAASQKYAEHAMDNLKVGVTDVFSDELKELTQWYGDTIYETSGNVSDFLKDNEKDIVRFVKELYKNGSALYEDVLQPIGSFIIDNSGAISGGLAAIFGINAVSRIASGASTLISVLSSLNPYMTAATGVITAVGVAIGAYQDYVKKIKEADLESRFGSVALSMSEIKDMAAEITAGGDLQTVSNILSEAKETDTAWENIADALSEIEKVNFKLSHKADAENSSTYVSAIDNYLKSVQKMIDQEQYTLSISASFLLGENNALTDPTSKAFEGIKNEVDALVEGTNNYINRAMTDGIIDERETDEIARLYLQRLSEITEKINSAQAAGKMESIAFKYGNNGLDASSFSAMLEEMGSANDENMNAALEARENVVTLANLNLQSGTISQSEYDSIIASANQEYRDKETEYNANAARWAMEILKTNYADVFGKAAGTDTAGIINGVLDEYFSDNYENNHLWDSDEDTMWESLIFATNQALRQDIDFGTRSTLSEYLAQIEPEFDALREYVRANKDVSEEYRQMLEDFDRVRAIMGNDEASNSLLLEAVKTDPETVDYIRKNNLGLLTDFFGDSETEYVRVVGDAFEDLKKDTDVESEKTAKAMYMSSQSYFEREYGKGFDIDTSVRINADITYDTAQAVQERIAEEKKKRERIRAASIGVDSNAGSYTVAHNAIGNIVRKPVLTTFAENGPEAAIPINNSARSRRLWLETGNMLGMNTGATINYSPVINISGSANRADINDALKNGYEDFKLYYSRLMRENARLSMR